MAFKRKPRPKPAKPTELDHWLQQISKLHQKQLAICIPPRPFQELQAIGMLDGSPELATLTFDGLQHVKELLQK